jgi:DNA-binding HxlR family transcriptional regulator
MRGADLKPLLAKLSPVSLSRHLTRLRHIGLIRRIGGTYRYYLTRIGRAAIAACCHITENVLIPALA